MSRNLRARARRDKAEALPPESKNPAERGLVGVLLAKLSTTSFLMQATH